MKQLLSIIIVLVLLDATGYAQSRNMRWRGTGAASAEPTSCWPNRDIFLCSGSGCSPNPSLLVCGADGVSWTSYTGSSGGSIANTSSVLKGNNAGGAVAASAGTDFVAPAGNVATATALAANGANCSAGSYPLGVDASGASESCTALSAVNGQTGTYQALAADFSNYKTITVASGTFTITLVASGSQPAAGQYIRVVNYGSGVVTIARSGQNINGGTSSLSLAAGSATSPTSAFIISDGTNYFASVTIGPAGNTSGNAATATALAANGTNCSAGNYPLGVDASGNAESCTAVPSAPSITSGTYASLPGTCATSDLYFTTDAPYTFRCTATNTWTAFFGGVGGMQVTVPPSAGWTADNSITSDFTHGYGYLTGATSGGSEGVRFLYRTVTKPFTVTALVQLDASDIAANESINAGLSFGFRTSNGNIVEADLTIAAGAWLGEILKYTSSTSLSAAYGDTIQGTGTNMATIMARPIWLQWKDDNSNNLSFYYSMDGNNFTQIGASHADTNFFGAAPTQAGIGVRTKTGAMKLTLYSWSVQ